MSTIPYCLLPFGNLHKRAAMGRTSFAPITPTNLITSPAGQDDVSLKGAGPKTPLDMPAAPQTPTEQALGTDADTLALRQEHEDLKHRQPRQKQSWPTSKRQNGGRRQGRSGKRAKSTPVARLRTAVYYPHSEENCYVRAVNAYTLD